VWQEVRDVRKLSICRGIRWILSPLRLPFRHPGDLRAARNLRDHERLMLPSPAVASRRRRTSAIPPPGHIERAGQEYREFTGQFEENRGSVYSH
jgi:hypothetical protein